jgi:3-oxoacyl-[acyl-carrier protein] reductase
LNWGIGIDGVDTKNLSTRLVNIRAVVTGSSRGIGRSIALAFAEQGANVIVNCDKSESEAKEVVKAIRGMGRKSSFCMADVRNFQDCLMLVDHTKKELGGIDVLVNNAGVTKDALLSNVSMDDWADIISVNLTGVMNCTKAVVDGMRAQHSGRIINISSVVGEMGNIGQSSYAASKAGVIGLTKTHARELARDGILVNAIAPGFTNSEMVRKIPEEVRERILKQIPLRRFAEPSEIAKVAVFLASNEATYITGQIIGVNGGLHV